MNQPTPAKRFRRTALRGTALRGTALRGTALRGTALRGTALRRTALRRTALRRTPRHNEGAVMLVVMLVLLMTTATAVFAIHATSSEIRAAGFSRQAMQTQYIGEAGVVSAFAWVDYYGADALRRAMTVSSRANEALGGPALNLAPFERPLRTGADAHRLDALDFSTLVSLPVEDGSSLGPRSAYDTWLVVDVYDRHRVVRAVPGDQAQGGGRLEYLGATYTSRGRTQLPSDHVSGTPGDRPYHEGASDARAFAISGPIGRQ